MEEFPSPGQAQKLLYPVEQRRLGGMTAKSRNFAFQKFLDGNRDIRVRKPHAGKLRRLYGRRGVKEALGGVRWQLLIGEVTLEPRPVEGGGG